MIIFYSRFTNRTQSIFLFLYFFSNLLAHDKKECSQFLLDNFFFLDFELKYESNSVFLHFSQLHGFAYFADFF